MITHIISPEVIKAIDAYIASVKASSAAFANLENLLNKHG